MLIKESAVKYFLEYCASQIFNFSGVEVFENIRNTSNAAFIQKQPLEVFYKRRVPKNCARFIGKHLCRSLFIIKLMASGLQVY